MSSYARSLVIAEALGLISIARAGVRAT